MGCLVMQYIYHSWTFNFLERQTVPLWLMLYRGGNHVLFSLLNVKSNNFLFLQYAVIVSPQLNKHVIKLFHFELIRLILTNYSFFLLTWPISTLPIWLMQVYLVFISCLLIHCVFNTAFHVNIHVQIEEIC